MRSRVLLVLFALLVAGCGDGDAAAVPGAATRVEITATVDDNVVAATLDAAGVPVVVTSGDGDPVLHRGENPDDWSAVQLVGIGMQGIWAIAVAPDDSVVMIADGPSGTEVVRVDAAGLLTRRSVDLSPGADTAPSYDTRNPLRTYAAFSADASTAVLLTVAVDPAAAPGELAEPTGQVELHRVEAATGVRSAHSTTQLPGPGPFDVLGLAVSPDGAMTTVAALMAPEGARSGKLADASTLNEALLRFDASLQPLDQVELAEQVIPGGGQPLVIDGDGTTYVLVSSIEKTGHSGMDLVSLARSAKETTVVNGLDDVFDADALLVGERGGFAYLPGWLSPAELGVTIIDLRDGAVAEQVELCERGFLGGRSALASDGGSLLLSGSCLTADEAESGDPQPTSLLVLR
jgi:hypothetical protein